MLPSSDNADNVSEIIHVQFIDYGTLFSIKLGENLLRISDELTEMPMFAIAVPLPRSLARSQLDELTKMVATAQDAQWDESVECNFKFYVEIDDFKKHETAPYDVVVGTVFVEFPSDGTTLDIATYLNRNQETTVVQSDEEVEHVSTPPPSPQPSSKIEFRQLNVNEEYVGWIPYLAKTGNRKIYFHLETDKARLQNLADELATVEKISIDERRGYVEDGCYLVRDQTQKWQRAVFERNHDDVAGFYCVDSGHFILQSDLEASSVCSLTSHFDVPALCFNFRPDSKYTGFEYKGPNFFVNILKADCFQNSRATSSFRTYCNFLNPNTSSIEVADFSDERYGKLHGLVSLPGDLAPTLVIVPTDNSSTPAECSIRIKHEGKFIGLTEYFERDMADSSNDVPPRVVRRVQTLPLPNIEITTGESVAFFPMGVKKASDGSVVFAGFLESHEQLIISVSDLLAEHFDLKSDKK